MLLIIMEGEEDIPAWRGRKTSPPRLPARRCLSLPCYSSASSRNDFTLPWECGVCLRILSALTRRCFGEVIGSASFMIMEHKGNNIRHSMGRCTTVAPARHPSDGALPIECVINMVPGAPPYPRQSQEVQQGEEQV